VPVSLIAKPPRELLLIRVIVPSAWWRITSRLPWTFVQLLLYFMVKPKFTLSPLSEIVPPPVANPRLGS